MKPSLRLRWHQFYVLLAIVDLLVIAGTIWFHHQALEGFRQLLDEFARFDNAERWLASLREKLVETASVVNDAARQGVTDSREAQFLRTVDSLIAQSASPLLRTESMQRFWSEVDQLRESGKRTVAALRGAKSNGTNNSMTELLATMNHHKSRALRYIDRESGKLLAEAADAQLAYQTLAGRHEVGEKLLAAALLANIAGMLWYRRKLQRTDEALLSQEQRLHAERRERLAAIGEICSGVAHGIQNPLASIHSSAELIVDLGRTDLATRQRAQDILSECGRLSSRIQKLLAFARAEPVTRTPVVIQVAVRDTLAELAPRFEAAGVFAEQIDGDRPLRVLADSHELEAILIELISNALQHAPRDTRVTVASACSGHEAVVDVTDRGPGIPAESREEIFRLFYTSRPGGTGVGLAAARRIAESLNGSLELHEAGGGTTFRLRIPLQPS